MPIGKVVKRRRVTALGVSEPADGLSSNCFVVDDQVIINGMTARTSEGKSAAPGDAYAQSVIAFERIKALMEAAGGTMGDIVKLNCYLTDIRHRDGFVQARRKFFTGDFPPCVVLGGVTFTDAELLIEVDAWAVLGSDPGQNY